jgi:hypothetical protein
MKKGYRKCVCCGNPFDYESFGWAAELGDDEGKPLCDDCYSGDSDDANVVTYYDSYGGVATSHVGTYAVHGEFDESELPELFEYARSLTWCGVGWRGSYNGKAPDGWANVIDDWFGTIDGYNIDGDLEKLRAKVEDEGDHPDFPMIIAFPRTSNVCACGIEVYVKEKDKAKFKTWIEN